MPNAISMDESPPVTSTSICRIDGDSGVLSFYGFDIKELVTSGSFEETCFLLWSGELPSQSELSDFKGAMSSQRPLTPRLEGVLRACVTSADPMRMLISTIGLCTETDQATNAPLPPPLQQASTLVARIPTIIAAYHRIHAGEEPIEPRDDLDHSENFLWMLHGSIPSTQEAEALDKMLMVRAEHELDPSTYTAVVSTWAGSDLGAAATAAACTLQGGHRDAAVRVLDLLDNVEGSEDRVQYIDNLVVQDRKIPGIGHPIYKTRDPRAEILQEWAAQLTKDSDDTKTYRTAIATLKLLRASPGGSLRFPNAIYYSAVLYRMLSIPSGLFTPVLVMCRLAGWAAHVMEANIRPQNVRPRAIYDGPPPRPYVKISQR